LRKRSFIPVSLLTIIVLIFSAFAQEEPTFHSQSNVVVVPTLVRDANGDAVYGLHAGDFTVEDDGVEQTVHMDEEDSSTPQEPLSLIVAIQTGRKAYHEFPRMKGLHDMLGPILEQPGAQIAIVPFDSQPVLMQDFTSDPRQIDAALKQIGGGDGGAAILDTINYCSDLLNKLPDGRRKVLLVISETRDHGSKTPIHNVVTLIGDSNITIYTLVFSPALSNILDTERGTNSEDMNAGPDLLSPLMMAMQAMRKNAPKAVASQTGGEYELFESRKRFESRMIDFTNHLHSRYLLSFQTNDPHPGLHRIRVKLKQANGATVLSRASYWAHSSTP
jgi:VWFA-related protein